MVKPKLSVVIPTYNRAELLNDSLRHLARQRLSTDDFEVIVADDGSSDDTEMVVKSYRNRLRISYVFQEDLGFRASAARNAGARLAKAPVLVFMDTGILVGPDWLRHHLAMHADRDRPVVVIGYAYAYNPPHPMPGIGEALAGALPEEVVERYRDDPAFLDIRHEQMALSGFDLDRKLLPWTLFFPMNSSLPAASFWAAGGFYEGFTVWGLEDMELGLRLWRQGMSFQVSTTAWALESPHDRDEERNWQNMQQNIPLFLARHPEPLVEVGWGLLMDRQIWEWEQEYRRLLDWTEQARGRDVAAEIATLTADLPAGHRVTIIGSGDATPARAATLLDFDETLLPDGGVHALGLHTQLADDSADTVVITSRLAGLWSRWAPRLLAEAHRIGRDVRLADDLAAAP